MYSTLNWSHCSDAMMSVVASRITGVSIVYSNVCSGADQRKHQSSASLASVREIHRWPVKPPHKGPVTRKKFSFDDVIMLIGSNKGLSPVWHQGFTWISTDTLPWNLGNWQANLIKDFSGRVCIWKCILQNEVNFNLVSICSNVTKYLHNNTRTVAVRAVTLPGLTRSKAQSSVWSNCSFNTLYLNDTIMKIHSITIAKTISPIHQCRIVIKWTTKTFRWISNTDLNIPCRQTGY